MIVCKVKFLLFSSIIIQIFFVVNSIILKNMQRIEANLLKSKFRGSILGVLAGDCCGLPFEFEENLQPLVIKNNLNRLEGPYYKAPFKKYSDDTEMTKVFAQTLINGYSQTSLAKNFTAEYFREPSRGYGNGVTKIFEKLRKSNFEDVTLPAKNQYFGTGSYGNGGGMRVAPAALFSHNDLQNLTSLVREATEVTHTHKFGIYGALLQAFAVQQAIYLHPKENPLDVFRFTDELLQKMREIETAEDDGMTENKKEFQTQLTEMKKLLERAEPPEVETVVDKLGHSLNALFSVPTAIYCFLRSHKTPMDAEKNGFRNTLEYAINLGGDTDTIASMACAIAGAYHGEEAISKNLLKHCESYEEIRDLADQLFEKFNEKK